MKSSYSRAGNYLAGQHPKPLTIIYGGDVDRNRKIASDYINTLIGPNARDELRIERNDWKAIATDPAWLSDASKAVGFFPGKRGILIHDLTDAATALLDELLGNWNVGDAVIVAQASSLTKASKLRKTFDDHPEAMMIAVYDEPISNGEIQTAIAKNGLTFENDAFEMIADYTQNFGKAALEGELEKISIFNGEYTAPITIDVVQNLLPAQVNTVADTIIAHMLSGKSREMLLHLRQAAAQGVTTHQISGGARRQVVQLLQVKSSTDARNTIAKLRPPLFGERRTQFEQYLRIWNIARLETALHALSNAESELRKGKRHLPDGAFAERTFLRVALMARSR